MSQATRVTGLLGAYYGFRGLSLLWVDAVLGPSVEPGLWVFIVFYGLDWVATVPPTVALCRTHFGLDRSAVVFGWVFASHMVGAGMGASVAGWIRTEHGAYHYAWLLAGVLCGLAAVISLTIPPPAARGDDPAVRSGPPGRPDHAGATPPR